MPEVAGTHPSPRQLAEYALGKLDAGGMAAVSDHLAGCPACRNTVDSYPPDSFIGQLKAAAKGGTLPPGPLPRSTRQGLNDPPPALAASGKYEVLGKLGQGGMGAVWKARHTFLKQLVAIKVMNAEAGARDEVRARFLREMQATASLRHPHIVQALDAEALGEHLILVMEYVEGITLDNLVSRKGPVPALYACRWMAQAAEGLQHAHEMGMVHRDVKPANLMITRDTKELKILDFGLARGPREAGVTGARTQMQMFMGTPEYVAPEQAKDARSADIRADVYSLGCTLYFLLAGHPPFERDNALETVLAHAQDPPPPLGVERPDLPAELVGAVARMMEKEPADRFQSPGEVAEALGRIGRGEGAGKTSAPRRLLADLPPMTPAAPSLPRPRPRTKKRPDRWKAVAALIFTGLCLAALAGYLLTLNLDGKVEVRIEVAEPGCKVTWDGKLLSIGLSDSGNPIKVQVLPCEEYKLKVEKDGFETVTDNFVYKKGDSRVVAVQIKRLPPAEGKLVVEVGEGGAELFLDGMRAEPGTVGGKPFEVGLKPGAHRLEAKKAGFENFVHNWTSRPGETEAVKVRLVRKSAPPPPQMVNGLPEVTNSVGMTLRRVPAGKFAMGSPAAEAYRRADEGPQHEVEITSPFWVGKHEVTQKQFREIMGYNPSYFSREGKGKPGANYSQNMPPAGGRSGVGPDTDDHPAENLSWEEADEFCRRLSDWPEEKAAGRRYRLLSEAEWEYSCRAGAEAYSAFALGARFGPRNANFNGAIPAAPPEERISLRASCKVGSYPPNAWGLHDMHGNVSEWCADGYYGNYYKHSPRSDPFPPSPASKPERVFRGGSWLSPWDHVRSAKRSRFNKFWRVHSIGFRVAIGPDLVESDPAGLQLEAEKHIPSFTTNSIGMRLARIPAGKSLMGSPKDEPGRAADEGTQHLVEITKSFQMGVFEVTQKQFREVMRYNPSYFSRDGRPSRPGEKYHHHPADGKGRVSGDTGDYPVENVTWQEAGDFCKKLSALLAEKKAGRSYRLPTEAEWEYACRADSPSYQVFHFGNTLSYRQANFGGPPYGVAPEGGPLARTTRVGSYESNDFGLYDMHGNVWEWCSDWYDRNYYIITPLKDPLGPPQGEARIYRGGCWDNGSGRNCRSACRASVHPAYRCSLVGFRVVAVP